MSLIKDLTLLFFSGIVLFSLTACAQNNSPADEVSTNINKNTTTDDKAPVAKASDTKEVPEDIEQKRAALKDWTLEGELGSIPEHISDSLPLSDQHNEGKWIKNELMSDEFDGKELDSDKWWPCNPDWKGRQPAYFYPGNVKVSGSKLQLSMKKEEPAEMPKGEGYHTYTSAAVRSKTKILYGYFEVNAKPMNSAGSSAFWFYDNNPEWWTEIDVFEIGGNSPGFENKVHMNMPVFHTPTEKEYFDLSKAWTSPSKLSDDYHVYGLEWDEAAIKFYIDGVVVRRVINTHWHQPLYMNFDSETMPDWFGLPVDKDLPSTFYIDYVRTWKKG